MQTLSKSFLTRAEQKKITAAVQKAEQSTSGEIVPMIVSRSHHYPVATVWGAVLLAFPLALILTTLASSFFWTDPYNLWLFLAFFIPLHLMLHKAVPMLPLLHRIFVSRSRAEEEVAEEAMKVFFTEKLYKTKDENGILLFISVFERRVCLLGDAGINARISQTEWDEIVTLITLGIKEKRQCKALCQAIEHVGDILKAHFPIQEDDENELHNLIIR